MTLDALFGFASLALKVAFGDKPEIP
jgi:hypothetical protein